MVNGNYEIYGDRAASEIEIVDDHIRRTAEKGNRHKVSVRVMAEKLDNETDSIKYEKKAKEPKLLRYSPNNNADESYSYIDCKFEPYDIKPYEDVPPRRYSSFAKKSRNSTEGSVNYGYSQSSSNCSSPSANLPTISEQCEQYGTYRAHCPSSTTVSEIVQNCDSKLNKYFATPRNDNGFLGKGSHPDSLYRVQTSGSADASKLVRSLHTLRWPAALLAVCAALTVFVYFLIPSNLEQVDSANGTFWVPENILTERLEHIASNESKEKESLQQNNESENKRTPEIDFYNAANDKNIAMSKTLPVVTETYNMKSRPAVPIFPAHITPEIQYGNENSDKVRSPKALETENTNYMVLDSTLKPHITHSPEIPFEIHLNESDDSIMETKGSVQNILNTETENNLMKNNGNKVDIFQTDQSKNIPKEESVNTGSNREEPQDEFKDLLELTKDSDSVATQVADLNSKTSRIKEIDDIAELEEFLNHHPVNSDVTFTSGHSKVFGISFEEANKLKSTTQNAMYYTRVSPTLPTWREKSFTTEKYLLNVLPDVSQCGSIRLPFCRGVLPYDLTGPSVRVGGRPVSTFLPQLEYMMASNCSSRLAYFACALLEPECSPPQHTPKMPCYNLCRAIIDDCEEYIPQELSVMFNCNSYSNANCISSKAPCNNREFPCGDGTCVPRGWICDGSLDCPDGEDESKCGACETHEFRCYASGSCILKQWVCDGYYDCPGGEDETARACALREEATKEHARELDEETAGSAPAPSIHRSNRLSLTPRRFIPQSAGADSDSSKELLETSDSNNALKRNYTRRLTPYSRQYRTKSKVNQEKDNKSFEDTGNNPVGVYQQQQIDGLNAKSVIVNNDMKTLQKGIIKEVDYYEELEKKPFSTSAEKKMNDNMKQTNNIPVIRGRAPEPRQESAIKIAESDNKVERVFDGATMLKKAAAESKAIRDFGEHTEANVAAEIPFQTGHSSPCPSGELRCVDGRCITLSQLCDGTIDCTDHADEDNCYT